MGFKAIALDYMMDNGMADDAPKTALAVYSPDSNENKQPLTVATSAQRMQGEGTTSEARGKVEPDGRQVVQGRVNVNGPNGEAYPPGPGHVAHQDDWLNPDVSKLPDYNPPAGYHTITKEEARAVPVGLGLPLAGAAAELPPPYNIAAAAGSYALSTDTAKDVAEYLLEGRKMEVADPDLSHLENQKKGYSD